MWWEDFSSQVSLCSDTSSATFQPGQAVLPSCASVSPSSKRKGGMRNNSQAIVRTS